MSYKLEYNASKNYLLGTASGDISPQEALAISNEGMAFASRYPECHAVLVDMNEARFKFSVTDLFYFPRAAGKHAAGLKMRAHIYKTALVVAEKTGLWSFLETVNYNIGFRTKIFTDVSAAENWLTEQAEA